MALSDILTDLRGDPRFMQNVVTWHTVPARAAQYAPLPGALHPALQNILRRRGIEQLYSHQIRAVDWALAGHNFAVVTPTASGKTLCYNLPVLHSLLADSQARALYLFPTKALAQDQLAKLRGLVHEIEDSMETDCAQQPQSSIDNCQLSMANSQWSVPAIDTYDGDTPSGRRAAVRRSVRLVLTNPDMLHAGILPYHTGWEDFFAHLRYVIIDEMHTYRGVFGSHVANVLRRLQRICAFYGSRPQYICTSATIANPDQLAARLLDQPIAVLDENGAPTVEKHIILYNPPLYDPERGLRRSSVLEAQDLATRTVLGGAQTIVFGRSRLTTEVLLTYVRERLARVPHKDSEDGSQEAEDRSQESASLVSSLQSPVSHTTTAIRGYRGGYLPEERRAIERGLRAGEVRAVVATNALELGIDIGQLQAAILCGYPGSIASTWQQMGRVGRVADANAALAILVATAGVLDQYIIQHPEFIFEQSPERALINPDNLMLLVDQVRCAAFELPFAEGDRFGSSPFVADVLALLHEQGTLQHYGGRYFWNGDAYPARRIGLRSVGGDAIVIQTRAEGSETGADTGTIIGEVDRLSAPFLVHEGAVYIHEGRSHRVERLDFEHNIAIVTPEDVDYYTQAATETNIDVLHEQQCAERRGARVGHGDVLVHAQVTSYRRVKRFTHENLGVIPLDYPPHSWETSGYWFSVLPETQAVLIAQGQWMDSPNEYGPNWQEQRQRVRARDGYRCSECGAPEPPQRQHDVHHVVPFRAFGYVPGLNENYKEANRLDNLVLVCRICHRRLEAAVRVRGGLDGVAYTLRNLASLHLMCDPQDIDVHVEREHVPNVTEADSTGSLPTIFVYERIAAGLGFGAQLFELHEELLARAHDLIRACPCTHGCPACVGPVLEHERVRLETKRLALVLLEALRGESAAISASDHPWHDEVDF